MTSSVQENQRRLHAEDDIGVKSLNDGDDVFIFSYIGDIFKVSS